MRLASGLGMLALLSLLLAIYWAYESVENGFYLMPGRAWEFAIGALVILLRQLSESGRIAWLERWRGRSILNSVGWLSILFAAVAYNDNLRYPGVWALLPCIGAALALLDAPERQPNSAMARLLLRQPILQFLGNISYSLYLWHWPVLNLGNQVFGTSLAIQLGLVSLCLILATATYYLLENPIHRAPIGSSASVLVTSLSFIAFGFFAMTTWEKAAEELLNGPETARIQAARFDIPELYSSECDTWHHSAKVSPCIFGHGNASKTVVMIGDSALAQWFPAISDIFLRRTDWRVIVLTKSACPASQVSYYYDRIKANYDVCDAWRQGALDFIAQQRADLVIMGITGKSAIAQVFFGSNTLKMAERKVCPVLIVPEKAVFSPIKNVMLTSDFKNTVSTTPSAPIKDFLDVFNPQLHVVNVDKDHYISLTEDYENEKQELKKLFADYKPELYFMRLYDVDEAINLFAESRNIDMIIAIQKNHSFIGKLLSGSRTKTLSYHSKMPILVMHE